MFNHCPVQLFANGGIWSKHLNSAHKVVNLATQDLYNTDACDMNKSVMNLAFSEFS